MRLRRRNRSSERTATHTHPYAYTSFRFDITAQLKFSAINVLAIRVDNSLQRNSPWYSGPGIYRHVRVVLTEPIHIAPWGVFVSTSEASTSFAKILIKTQLEGEAAESGEVKLKTAVIGPSGAKVRAMTTTVKLQSGQPQEVVQWLTVTVHISGYPQFPISIEQSHELPGTANCSIWSRSPSVSCLLCVRR